MTSTVNGTSNNDLLYGGSGATSVNGGNGSDTIYAGGGNDTVNGGEGEDVVYGDRANTSYIPTQSKDISNIVLYLANAQGQILKVKIEDFEDDCRDPDQLPIAKFIADEYPGRTLVAMTVKAGNNSSGMGSGEGTLYILDSRYTQATLPKTDVDDDHEWEYDDALECRDGAGLFADVPGNDSILGGNGNDTLYGDGGNDTIRGEGGTNKIYGDGQTEATGDGADSLFGGDTNDTIYGGGGADYIDGGAGSGWLYGGSGNDTILGGNTNDTIYGGTGNDSIVGGGGSDQIWGEGGDDSLLGSNTNDSLYGGDGADTINGAGGADHVDAGAGNDVGIFVSGEGAGDFYNGGLGTDTLRLEVSQAVYDSAQFKAEAIAYLAQNTATANSTNGNTFKFESLNASFKNWESAEIYVGGQKMAWPTNSPPPAPPPPPPAPPPPPPAPPPPPPAPPPPPPALNPLFTDNPDTVNLNNVTVGTYIDGTQYDALKSNDNVILAANAAEAAQAGYDTTKAFKAGAGNDTVQGGELADTILGGTGNDSLAGGDGDDVLNGNGGPADTGSALSLTTADTNVNVAATVAAWAASGVTVEAFNVDGGGTYTAASFGTKNVSFTLGAGNTANSALWGNYAYSGIAVAGGIDGGEVDTGNGAHTDGGEVIRLTFASPMTSVTVELSALFDGENVQSPDKGPYDNGYLEKAQWKAFGANGETLTGVIEGTVNGLASATINAAFPIVKIELTALDAGAGNSGDNSDFLLRSVSGQTVAATDNDLLQGGAGADVLDGDEGNDTLDGGAGNDTVYGDVGNDIGIYVASPAAVDSYDGGVGTDTIKIYVSGAQFANLAILTELAAFNLFLQANSNPLTDSGPTFTFATLGLSAQDWEEGQLYVDNVLVNWPVLPPLFTPGYDHVNFDDVVAGTYLPGTQYNALAGDDYVFLPLNATEATQAGYAFSGSVAEAFYAGDGNDSIVGGELCEPIYGGNGDDALYGYFGHDSLYGGAGDDLLYFSTDFVCPTSQTFYVSADDCSSAVGLAVQLGGLFLSFDVLDGGADVDTVVGSNGGDLIVLDNGNVDYPLIVDVEVIDGEAGNDLIDLSSLRFNYGDVTLIGGLGNDTVFSSVGDDLIQGGFGDDVLVGNLGDDTIQGGPGDDLAYGGSGDDVLIGDNAGDNTLPGGSTTSAIGQTPDGLYAVSGASSVTLDLENMGQASAGYQNSFGYYFADASGTPLSGFVVWDNQHATVGQTYSAAFSAAQLAGATYIGLFIIPNGNALNAGLASGTPVTFQQVSGQWTAFSGATPLAGTGAPLLFSDRTLNANQYDYESDSGLPGNSNWEDILGGGDKDFNDVNIQVDLTKTVTVNLTFNDTLHGDCGDDSIAGVYGDDVLFGGGGEDTITGDEGDDSIQGGAGDDLAYGGVGNDTLVGDEACPTPVAVSQSPDGLYAVTDSQAASITVAYNSSNAGYNNSYGYFLADANGQPLRGEVIWRNVKTAGGPVTIELDRAALAGVAYIGFFIIPDGADTNPALTNGTDVTFALVAGKWTAFVGATPLVGQDAPALFSAPDLNANQFDYETDNGAPGNSNWEDILGGGDDDFNDVNVNVSLTATASAQDTLYGDDGDDVISGVCDDDSLFGGAGSDVLFGGVGDDTAYGGDGRDSLDGEAGDDVLYGDADGDCVHGGDGADTLYGGTGVDSINGDDGDDLVYGGADGDEIYGGLGDDVMHGDAGNDTISGGEGDDLALGGDGDDLIYGWTGDDTVQGGAGIDILVGDAGADLLAGGDDGDSIYGGADNDTVQGDGGNDWLEGNAGDDSIDGGTGSDLLAGGIGADTLNGGDGDDAAYGWDDNDLLTGGAGNDTLVGDDGDDTVDGGADNDALYGKNGNDSLRGGLGGDWLEGGAGKDTVLGEDGDDVAFGGEGDDTVDGGAGDDLVYGNEGQDSVRGGLGNDRVEGYDGEDTLHGDDGDDVVLGGNDSDVMFGGAGQDSLYGWSGNELAFGGADADVVVGDAGADTLYGDAGNDSVYGGADDDELNGGDGDDYLEGSTGNDIAFGGAGADRIELGEGDDTAYGDDGDDVILGDLGADQLFGGAGTDVLVGGAGADKIDGDEGDDWLYGQGDNDSLYGGAGIDRIEAGAGDDLAFGGDGQDYVHGGDGSDTAHGGADNDTVIGSQGSDSLCGDAGDDYVLGDDGDSLPVAKVGSLYPVGGDMPIEVWIGAISSNAGNNNSFGWYLADASGNPMSGAVVWADVKDHLGDTLTFALEPSQFAGASFLGFFIVPDGGDLNGALADGTAVSFAHEGGAWVPKVGSTALVGAGAPALFSDPALNAGQFDYEQDNADPGNSNWEDIVGGGDFDFNDVNIEIAVANVLDGGNDTLCGAEGNDTLYGNWGADLLNGGVGNDSLWGGYGNDTIIGGDGNDTMVGGMGDDQFWFGRANPGSGPNQDLIIDTVGANSLVIYGDHATLNPDTAGVSLNDLTFTKSASAWTISFTNGDGSITFNPHGIDQITVQSGGAAVNLLMWDGDEYQVHDGNGNSLGWAI